MLLKNCKKNYLHQNSLKNNFPSVMQLIKKRRKSERKQKNTLTGKELDKNLAFLLNEFSKF